MGKITSPAVNGSARPANLLKPRAVLVIFRSLLTYEHRKTTNNHDLKWTFEGNFQAGYVLNLNVLNVGCLNIYYPQQFVIHVCKPETARL